MGLVTANRTCYPVVFKKQAFLENVGKMQKKNSSKCLFIQEDYKCNFPKNMPEKILNRHRQGFSLPLKTVNFQNTSVYRPFDFLHV